MTYITLAFFHFYNLKTIVFLLFLCILSRVRSHIYFYSKFFVKFPKGKGFKTTHVKPKLCLNKLLNIYCGVYDCILWNIYFFIQVFLESKFFPSLIDNISLIVPYPSIGNFTHFPVARKIFPSARCATAASLVCSYMDISSKQIRFLKQILR